MSTNSLFYGWNDDHTVFSENTIPIPRGAYAWSKFAAEQAVLAAPTGAVIRANFFTRYCNGKQSFIKHVLSCARANKPIPCYSDVLVTPVFAGTLAEFIVDRALNPSWGVFHVCSSDEVNRVEQAKLILTNYGLLDSLIVEKNAATPSNGCLTSVTGGIAGTVASETAKMIAYEPLEPL